MMHRKLLPQVMTAIFSILMLTGCLASKASPPSSDQTANTTFEQQAAPADETTKSKLLRDWKLSAKTSCFLECDQLF